MQISDRFAADEVDATAIAEKFEPA